MLAPATNFEMPGRVTSVGRIEGRKERRTARPQLTNFKMLVAKQRKPAKMQAPWFALFQRCVISTSFDCRVCRAESIRCSCAFN
jgi:hypothetical protein